ncbi:acyltransferase [Weissella ceti]|uniref:Acyltransferase n=1 Tax=Weissella ceti TaxID=759620 RepID=A0ABT3E5X0_9LACO|nr:acyltransferase [Weissella ceti]MCW0953813.1 acyltransferase [Weissella ceti]QVK11882.1 acyltransferase [Weissella ceti]
MPQRISWIDVAKGLTILLVVFGHVIIGLFDANLYIGQTQANLLNTVQSIYLFHMPVFIAFSGYFFTRTASINSFIERLKKRSISIGIPYLVFSVILLFLFQLGGSKVRAMYDWHSLSQLWQIPIGPLWFLDVLFGVIIANSALSMFIKDTRVHFAIACLLALMANFWIVPIYAIQRILIWSPFFLLGALLRKYPLKGSWLSISLLTSIYGFYLIIWANAGHTSRVSYNAPGVDGIIMLIAVMLAFMIFPKINLQTAFGRYFNHVGQLSLGIYLVHVPIVSATRMLLLQLGYHNVFLHIVIGSLIGWFGSLLILKYVSVLNYVLYPLNYIQIKKKVS